MRQRAKWTWRMCCSKIARVVVTRMQIVAPAVKSSALWLGRLCVVVGDETGIVVTVSPSFTLNV